MTTTRRGFLKLAGGLVAAAVAAPIVAPSIAQAAPFIPAERLDYVPKPLTYPASSPNWRQIAALYDQALATRAEFMSSYHPRYFDPITYRWDPELYGAEDFNAQVEKWRAEGFRAIGEGPDLYEPIKIEPGKIVAVPGKIEPIEYPADGIGFYGEYPIKTPPGTIAEAQGDFLTFTYRDPSEFTVPLKERNVRLARSFLDGIHGSGILPNIARPGHLA